MPVLGRNGYLGRNLEARGPYKATINARGCKDIPWCEQNNIAAYKANAFLPEMLAKDHDNFIHISSDHAHCDGPQSKTIYAQSKRLGDQLVMQANPKAMILVTGHVIAPGCPWINWLDGELRAGRKVVAFTNRICSPSWIGDIVRECKRPSPGLRFVLGPSAVNRFVLFTAYADVFGYDSKLIVPGEEVNPLLAGDSSHASDVPTIGIYEAFERLKSGAD